MKQLSVSSKSFVPSDAVDSEIDIDVKPMMGVLIILIPFLVSVAVYTRIAIIDLSLPPNITSVALPGSGEKPMPKLTVVVAQNYFCITLGETLLDSIPRTDEKISYDSLAQCLDKRKQSGQSNEEIIVASRDGIQFKYVVRVMDACTKSGFSKVSLASATDNPAEGK